MNHEQIIQPGESKEILTIDKVLGPNGDYNQIILDLKNWLAKHEDGIVVSDFEEAGISATNEYFREEKNRPVDPSVYKDVHQQWIEFKKKKNIQVPTDVLGRFLYCRGEKDLAKQVDIGHGPKGQHNPSEYLGNTVCPN